MSEIVVGLDIGTTKIACFVGRKTEHGKIEILSMGRSESVGVSRGVVSNIEKTVQSIKVAIEEAQERIEGELSIKLVNVGIAGQHISSLQHRGMLTRDDLDNEISQNDIDDLIEDMYKLIMQPGEEIIHVLPQEYKVDGQARQYNLPHAIPFCVSHFLKRLLLGLMIAFPEYLFYGARKRTNFLVSSTSYNTQHGMQHHSVYYSSSLVL